MRDSSALVPLLLCLAVAAVPRPAVAEPGAQWPEGNWFCAWGPAEEGCANPHGAGSLVETPHMKLGARAAPWLLPFVAVLMRNRPWDYRAETFALMTGEAGTQYLVVEWDGPPWFWAFPQVEFHKVVHGSDGRRKLKWLRGLGSERADLSPLSGRLLFEGEAPVAVVNLQGGGSAPYNNEVRLIQLKRNSVDITPDWAGRTVNVVDLDGDGRFEVVTSGGNLFVNFGHLVNGPFVPVILARTDRRFVYDCRRFRGLFENRSRRVESFALEQANDPMGQLAWFAEAFLGFLQVGAFEDALRMQRRITKLAVERPDFRFTAEQIDEDLSSALDWVMKHPEKDCPVSAPDNPGGPNGALIQWDIYLSKPQSTSRGN